MTYIELMRDMIAEDLKYFGKDLDDYFSDLAYHNDMNTDSDEYRTAVIKGKAILAELEEKVRKWEI